MVRTAACRLRIANVRRYVFLLRSRHHPAAGLMRAAYVSADLVGPERQGLVLSAAEVTRLASIATIGSD